jgi:hypothetical protein
MITTGKVFQQVFRFSATAAITTQNYTTLDLSYLFIQAATITTAYPVMGSYHLKMIEIWGTSAAIGTTSTVDIEWNSTATQTANTSVSDTVLSPFQNAHVRSPPPANSNASFWQDTGSAGASILFSITCPANSVVDITVDFTINWQEPAGTQRVVAGATPGTVYVPNLGGTTLAAVLPLNAIA